MKEIQRNWVGSPKLLQIILNNYCAKILLNYGSSFSLFHLEG
jgi:hypothetical protein